MISHYINFIFPSHDYLAEFLKGHSYAFFASYTYMFIIRIFLINSNQLFILTTIFILY